MVRINIASRTVDGEVEFPSENLKHWELLCPSLIVDKFEDDGSITIEVDDKEGPDLVADLEASEWKNDIR